MDRIWQEQTVDPGTLKYIFKDRDSQREDIHQEAFELCEKDLKERDKEENASFSGFFCFI